MIKHSKLINLLLITSILMIAAIAPAFAPSCFAGLSVYAGDDDQSSFEYKYYKDNDSYREILKRKMNDVFTQSGGMIIDESTFPIPGLVITRTVKDGVVESSKKFVPQGICRAEDYILITAYDAKKKLNSVIYVVDPVKGSLVSTLTLPHKYHVGGIAFDGANIWLTGNTSDKYEGEPFVQYLPFDTFRNLITKPLNEITGKDISKRQYIKNRPSFLECDNGILWVGSYIGRKDTAEGYMNGYKITEGEDGPTLNTMMYTMVAGLDASVQGVDISGEFLYVSSSYKGSVQGVKSSFVTKYHVPGISRGNQNYYLEGKEISRIEVPKMNEEILVEDGKVHILFESGADSWKTAVVRTDRVLALKGSLWGIFR